VLKNVVSETFVAIESSIIVNSSEAVSCHRSTAAVCCSLPRSRMKPRSISFQPCQVSQTLLSTSCSSRLQKGGQISESWLLQCNIPKRVVQEGSPIPRMFCYLLCCRGFSLTNNGGFHQFVNLSDVVVSLRMWFPRRII
jgi:hypothetical protein